MPLAGRRHGLHAGSVHRQLTALGWVPAGPMVRRAGAQPGDSCWSVGRSATDAGPGRGDQGEIDDPDGQLAYRYRLPTPRTALRRPAAGGQRRGRRLGRPGRRRPPYRRGQRRRPRDRPRPHAALGCGRAWLDAARPRRGLLRWPPAATTTRSSPPSQWRRSAR